MTSTNERIFIGVHGFVMALDRSSGAELWRVELKGSDFVNLILDGDQLLATTKGEIFCLDASTGAQKWNNKLPGMGLGLISVVTADAPSKSIGPEAELRRRQQQAAAAAAGTAAAAK